jgi:hypothetical protein
VNNLKKYLTIQNLAWLYAFMFLVIGSLAHIPFINDAQGYTLGIFKLDWWDDALHYASGLWAGIAAWRSRRDAVFYFKLFGLMYGLDGIMGFFLGQGYLDLGIILNGPTALDWGFKFFANIPHITIGSIAAFIGFYMSRKID